MLTYANDLISKTQGRATYSMEFSHYDYVPNELADKVIAAHKAARRAPRRRRSLADGIQTGNIVVTQLRNDGDMPPNLDVYVISHARDRETIETVPERVRDRAASENRGDEQLMILALDAVGQPSEGDNWDWEPSRNLTHIIERGLEHPRRAFSVYLKTRGFIVGRGDAQLHDG